MSRQPCRCTRRELLLLCHTGNQAEPGCAHLRITSQAVTIPGRGRRRGAVCWLGSSTARCCDCFRGRCLGSRNCSVPRTDRTPVSNCFTITGNPNAAGGLPGTQSRECENAVAVPDKGPGGAWFLPCHPSGKHSPIPASPPVPRPSPCLGEGTACPAAVVVQGMPVLEAVVLVALVADDLHHLLLLAARLQTLVGEDLKDNVEVAKKNTPARAGAVPLLHARPWALTNVPSQCHFWGALEFASKY